MAFVYRDSCSLVGILTTSTAHSDTRITPEWGRTGHLRALESGLIDLHGSVRLQGLWFARLAVQTVLRPARRRRSRSWTRAADSLPGELEYKRTDTFGPLRCAMAKPVRL